VHKRVVVELDFSDEYQPVPKAEATYAEIYRSMLQNPPGLGRVRVQSAPDRMLILAAAPFVDDPASRLPAFVAWKRMTGLAVELQRVEAGTPPARLLELVTAAYGDAARRPSYLLLVGSDTTLPPFKRPTSNGTAATDYPLSLLDGPDTLPDVIVGRIVANDVAAANNQLAKSIDYEKNPQAGAEWYGRGLGIASSEGSGPSDVEYITSIADRLKAGSYSAFQELREGESTATIANLKAALAEGRSWITYIGHGSGTSWPSTNDEFSIADIESLENVGKLPVIVDVACQNGSYDDRNCFGETWMNVGTTERPLGAVAYYGASVNTSWHPPAIMARGVAIRHYASSTFSFGGSCLAGQLYLAEQMGATDSDVTDNFTWFNLFGDPSLTMRTATPQALAVAHPQVLPLGSGSVTVDLLGPQTAKGLQVSLYDPASGALATRRLEGPGSVVLEVEPLSEVKTLQVVVTGYNAIPYVADVPVVVLDEPYLAFASRTHVTDASGDGEASPGDALTTRLSLRNLGRQGAVTPVVTVSSQSPCVVIDDALASFETLGPDATGAAQDEFGWHVTQDCPNATVASFVAAWRAGDHQGTVRFSETIKAPVLRMVSARLVADDGGNGMPDPGEVVTLAVTVANEGLLASRATEVAAASGSASVEVPSAGSPIPAIAAGQRGEAVFQVRIAADAAIGSVAPVSFTLGGGTLSHDLTIGTALVRTFESSQLVEVPDPGQATSALEVPAGRVQSVRVHVDIAHSYIGDLTITLVSPQGTKVVLRAQSWSGQNDLLGWFPTELPPAGDLGVLAGQPAGGRWTLELADGLSPDAGQLRAWRLEVTGYFPAGS
jgi:hypothetical protein